MRPFINAGSVPAAILKATHLRRERSAQLVLSDISLTVAPGDRIGVVGPNGVGKTTLLRTLAGLEVPDGGRVEVSPPGAQVGYLTQERDRPHNESVEAYLQRRTGTADAEAALEKAVQRLADGDMSEDAQAVYAHALERFNRADPGGFEARAAETLASLGGTAALLSADMAGLSGGEAARVGLAAMMLSRYDITLLDEPTNDLDFRGLEDLERLVLALPGGVVVVSHDREFLARTVNAVLEIDEHTREATLFGGNWASYVQEKAAVARHKEEAWDQYRQTREDLVGRAQREKLWATSGVARERKAPTDKDKAQRDFRINRTEQLAARARRTERPWNAWRKWKSRGSPGISATPSSWRPEQARWWPPLPVRLWPKVRSAWARSTCWSNGGTEWPLRAPMVRARPPWSTPCSAVSAFWPVLERSGRVSWWASWARTG